jgi:Sec-independent protein translocase protein TatA
MSVGTVLLLVLLVVFIWLAATQKLPAMVDAIKGVKAAPAQ